MGWTLLSLRAPGLPDRPSVLLLAIGCHSEAPIKEAKLDGADGRFPCGYRWGGPAVSLTAYFLLNLADRVGTDIVVDIYEPRDFSAAAPAGCNMCGGIVSESMVKMLATEGINLPSNVVQRGIDSKRVHEDPSLAFRILQMSERILRLNGEVKVLTEKLRGPREPSASPLERFLRITHLTD